MNELSLRVTALKDELEELVDSFYEGCVLRRTRNCDGENITIEDAVEDLFKKYKDAILVYSIEADNYYSDNSQKIGVTSIAYVNLVTGLEHFILRWERV